MSENNNMHSLVDEIWELIDDLEYSGLSDEVKTKIAQVLEEYKPLIFENIEKEERIIRLKKELFYLKQLNKRVIALPDQNNVFSFSVNDWEIVFDYISKTLRKKRVSEFRLLEVIETQIWKERFLDLFNENKIDKWIIDTEFKVMLDKEYIINIALAEDEWEKIFLVYLINMQKNKQS